uniref:Uncharacterized protein n=1 Tax=Fagus sylvatica TaxID=28930 RepID=A0A2N9F067_FAGSY
MVQRGEVRRGTMLAVSCGGVSSGFDQGNGGHVWVVNSQLLLRQWLCGFAVAFGLGGFVEASGRFGGGGFLVDLSVLGCASHFNLGKCQIVS